MVDSGLKLSYFIKMLNAAYKKHGDMPVFWRHEDGSCDNISQGAVATERVNSSTTRQVMIFTATTEELQLCKGCEVCRAGGTH